MMKLLMMILCVGLAAAVGAPVAAHEPSAAAKAGYAPFEWLVGDWYSSAGPNGAIHQKITFAPHRSYLSYSTFIGKPEKLHFEGIAVWNGKTKALDYVFAVEPGSGVQEKGTLHAEADGSVVREVEFTGPKGDVGQFRQRFWRTASGEVMTSLMRKTASGWEPNFPGSDKIAMNRKPG